MVVYRIIVVFFAGLAFVVRIDFINKLSFCSIVGVVCSKRFIVSIRLSTPENDDGFKPLSNVRSVLGSTGPFNKRQFPPSSSVD